MDDDRDLATEVSELVRTLRDLERELRRSRRSGVRRLVPRPSELRRFTSEVAIPGAILVLETNVRALRLLQRALRLPDENGTDEGRTLADRAESVSRDTLSRLDDVLNELQDAYEGRPNDEAARDLLEEARELRDEIDRRLSERSEVGSGDAPSETDPDGATAPDEGSAGGTDPPEVDVDAELDAIKDELDDGDDADDGEET